MVRILLDEMRAKRDAEIQREVAVVLDKLVRTVEATCKWQPTVVDATRPAWAPLQPSGASVVRGMTPRLRPGAKAFTQSSLNPNAPVFTPHWYYSGYGWYAPI